MYRAPPATSKDVTEVSSDLHDAPAPKDPPSYSFDLGQLPLELRAKVAMQAALEGKGDDRLRYRARLLLVSHEFHSFVVAECYRVRRMLVSRALMLTRVAR
jgi:hypothetical protein